MPRYRSVRDTEMLSLTDALSSRLRVGELKQLTRLVGSRVPNRKAELVALIEARLSGEGLREVFESLDEMQKAAVAEVAHSPGTRYHKDRFVAKYGGEPEWGTLNEFNRGMPPTRLRLFFYGGMMPVDLKDRLRAFVPPPGAPAVEAIEELPPAYELPVVSWHDDKEPEHAPLVVLESEGRAQRELLTVLRLVDAGKIAVGDRTRLPSAASVEAVSQVLEGGDYYPHVAPKDKWHDENAGPVRAFAWPMLIQGGKLAHASGKRLQLSRSGRKALGGPPAQTIRSLWRSWMGTTVLDELRRIDCVKGQNRKGRGSLTAVAHRRSTIEDALGECPPAVWIEVDELVRFMRASGNGFEVSHNPWNLYVEDAHYGSLGYDGCEGIVELRYLLCVLFEYASTLGLIDVAFVPPAGARSDFHKLWGTDDLPYFSRYDGLIYFRINALGAFCLDLTDTYESSPTERKPVLRVLPTLEIAATGEGLEQSDRLALDAFCEPVSDVVWKLDAAKVLAAVEAGRLVGELREFLTARSVGPLPDAAAYLLNDVEERCGKLRDVGLARLIECSDDVLAALISSDSRAGKHCMRAGERHLAVPGASETAFRRGLREMGYVLTGSGTTVSEQETTRKPSFTKKHGEYLSFIHGYTKVHGVPPAEADIQRYFGVTPPSVHQMILRLEEKGLISRVPGKARSIRVLVEEEAIPRLE